MRYAMGWGAHGEAQGSVRRQREGKRGQEPLLWLLQEGMDEAGEAGLGLASLDNVGGL